MRKGVKRVLVMLLCSALLLQTQVQNVHASDASEIAGEVAETEGNDETSASEAVSDIDDAEFSTDDVAGENISDEAASKNGVDETADENDTDGSKSDSLSDAKTSNEEVVDNGEDATVAEDNFTDADDEGISDSDANENANDESADTDEIAAEDSELDDAVMLMNSQEDSEEDDSADFQIEDGVLVKYIGNKENVVIPDGVTEIGRYAFYNKREMVSVSMPKTLKKIKNYAFYYCGGLEEITLPVALEEIDGDAFYYCSNLKKATFENAATKIWGYAFSSNVTIYATVDSRPIAYAKDRKMNYVIIEDEDISYSFVSDEVKVMKGYYKKLEISPKPEGRLITWSADNWDVLSLLEDGTVIPESEGTVSITAKINGYPEVLRCTVTVIGTSEEELEKDDSSDYEIRDGVLLGYNGNKVDITIPDGVRVIGKKAFYNNKLIRTVTLPDSVELIEDEAFQNSCLEYITFSDSLKSIGVKAFSACYLETVEFPSSLEYLGEYSFANCQNLYDVTFANGLKRIENCAFVDCNGLCYVKFPDTLEVVGGAAFENCWNLNEAVFSKNLKEIGSNAFYSCGISKIVIPNPFINTKSWFWDDWVSEGFGAPTFYAPKNSTVESFAKSNGFGFVALEPEFLLDQDAVVLEVGESIRLTATMKTTGETINWVSENDSIATVSSNGTVKACSEGKVKIYAEVEGNPESFYCTVTVRKASGNISDAFKIKDGVLEKYVGSKNYVIIPDGVTEIGKGAFSGKNNIETVTMPDTVTIIGNSAFSNCMGLKSVIISNSLEEIGNNSFYGCRSLTDIRLPETLKTIGNKVFYDCKSLTEIEWPASIKAIEDYEFYACDSLKKVLLPNSLESIGELAFSWCDSLEEITLPASLNSIGEAAFWRCEKLKRLKFTSSLYEIGGDAFGGCWNLKEVTLQDSVGEFDLNIFDEYEYTYGYYEQLFYENNKSDDYYAPHVQIEKLNVYGIDTVISGSLKTPSADFAIYTYRGSNAYAYAKRNGIKIVILDDGENNEEFFIKDGVLIEYYGNEISVAIPDGVTEVGINAFADKKNIKSITFSSSVEIIGNYAFAGCTGLESLILPESVKEISYCSFSGCSGLEKVVLPETLVKIGKGAFNNCSNLKKLLFLNPDTTIDEGDIAEKCSDLIIFGYEGSTAEEYAKKHSIPFCKFSEDGEVCFESKKAMLIGDKEQISVSMIPGGKSVTWKSDNDAIASVDDEGMVTACSKGVAKIYAIVDGITSDSFCAVTVYDMPVYSDKEFNIKDGVLIKYIGNKTNVVIPEGVMEIADKAFQSQQKIESVYMPDSVKKIGGYAFSNCTKLKKLRLSESLECFGKYSVSYCTELEKIVIPDSVNKIGDDAFAGDKKLKEISLPDSVKCIGSGAFWNCGSLEKMVIHNFDTEFIRDAVFADCDCLTIYAFYGSTADKYARDHRIPISYLDEFDEDYEIKDGVLVRYHGTEKTITIPDNVNEIGEYAFYSNKKVKKVVIQDNIKKIGENAFANCSNLEEVIFPKTLKEIGSYSFYGCLKLTNITWPKSLERINFYAFSGCNSLQEIEFPNLLKIIEKDAFYNCKKLEKVIFSKSLRVINNWAFEGCANLKKAIFHNYEMDNIGWGVFVQNTAKIYAYEGSYAATYARKNNIKLVILNQPETLKVSITPATLELIAGDFDRLTTSKLPEGKTVTWVSENDSIAQVYADGTVVAFSEGTVKIYAKVDGASNTPYCTVTVKPTPKEKAPEEYTEAEKENFIEYIARKCKPYIDKSQIKDIVINDYNNHGEESEATLKKYGITLEKVLSIFERVFNE